MAFDNIPASDEPTCPACSKPIRPEMPVAFEHGETVHLACRSRATTFRAIELGERTAESLARAAETVEQSTWLLRRLVCAVCKRALAEENAAIRRGDVYVHLACADEPG